jgi:hypothetical protein
MSYKSIDSIALTSLDTDWFVDEYDEDYKCIICLQIPCSPAECSVCGQIYCKECINQALTNKKICSKCKAPINVKNIKENAFVCQKISGLKIKCKHEGCDKTFLVGKNGTTAFKHYEQCPCGKVVCNNCNKVMTLKDFYSHLDEHLGGYITIQPTDTYYATIDGWKAFNEPYNLCKQWVNNNGKLPKYKSKNKEERKLATWIKDRKSDRKNSRLTDKQIEMLGSIKGWSW